MHIARYGKTRYWAAYDGATLVCVCLYKKGAQEVVRRLTGRYAVPRSSPVPGGFFCACGSQRPLACRGV